MTRRTGYEGAYRAALVVADRKAEGEKGERCAQDAASRRSVTRSLFCHGAVAEVEVARGRKAD